MADDALTGWRKLVAGVGSGVEHTVDDLKHAVKRHFGYAEPIHVQLYRGWGTPTRVTVLGRVLEREGPGAPEPDESTWDNVARIYKAFESDEIPGARVRVEFAGQARELEADREGYLEATFEAGAGEGAFGEGVLPVRAELLGPLSDDADQKRHFEGEVFVPAAADELIVISDVDDTVMHTEATSLLKAAFNTLRRNAYRRTAFPGVSAFYRALRDGSEAGTASFFYLTSSAWNVYDVMRLFFEVSDVPTGPILMRDLGLSPDKLVKGTHSRHKLRRVREILATYPDKRFVLIGDTGQHDAEIYRDVIEGLAEDGDAGRVAAVYLRDVSPDRRDAQVQEIIDHLGELGVPAVADETSHAHAEHAATLGLVDPSRLGEIKGQADEDADAKAEESGG